jgi:hypothetical protein
VRLLPLILLLTGCCYVRVGDTEVITLGTGRRVIKVGDVTVSHSEIADTLRASGELVGAGVKAAGYGGPVDHPVGPYIGGGLK